MGTKREAVWAERKLVVERWEGSGLSMAEFCRREGIGYLQFVSWRKRLSGSAETEVAGGFAELVVAGEERASGGERKALLEIVLPSGIVVRAFERADAPVIRAALEAVRGC